jgi:hypothetical protein
MRIYDHRYDRERLRFEIALRFIRLEARTHTIRLWTGLTDDRIRKLYRSYLLDRGEPPLPRHRGRSPQQVGIFLRSTRLRQETGLLAGLCCLLGVLPERTGAARAPAVAEPAATAGPAATAAQAALTLPSLARAQLLCQAYEIYRALLGRPLLTFEHAVFLLSTLVRAQELVCNRCRDCHAVVVVDRWSLRPARCEVCGAQAETTTAETTADPPPTSLLPLVRAVC